MSYKSLQRLKPASIKGTARTIPSIQAGRPAPYITASTQTSGSSALAPSSKDLEDELARRDLIEFVLLTKPDYLAGLFHQELAEALDKFLDDVIAKKSPRLMIFAPPRHGKTEGVSTRFPAYALGRYPDLSFIATSYASDLASSINRNVQRVIDGDRYDGVFPGTTLWGKNIRTVADGSYLRNSDIFEIVDHQGVYKSAGVGAGITGRGGNICMIDDPIKDAAEANSKTVRDGIWEWYQSTFYTRVAPGGGILIILTRWHEDDLAGRLLAEAKKGGEQWDVIKFPAIAEEDEYSRFSGKLLRKVGEPLHPERYSLEMLQRIKVAVGTRVWESLYQQRPTAREGAIFKRENWQYLKPPAPLSDMLAAGTLGDYLRELGVRRMIQRWDTALGAKKQNDYSACTTLAIAKSRYYVLDVWKAQLEYPEVKRKMAQLHDKWRLPGHSLKVVVEGGGSASGKASVQELKRSTTMPLSEQVTANDKVFRAELISPSHEAKLCTLFEGEAWVGDFVEQCQQFPNAKNDDDVDSFIGAMEEALDKPGPMIITDEFLQMMETI